METDMEIKASAGPLGVGDKVEVVMLKRGDSERTATDKPSMVCLGDVGVIQAVVQVEDKAAARRGRKASRSLFRVKCRENGRDVWLADFRDDELSRVR